MIFYQPSNRSYIDRVWLKTHLLKLQVNNFSFVEELTFAEALAKHLQYFPFWEMGYNCNLYFRDCCVQTKKPSDTLGTVYITQFKEFL